MAKDNNKQKQIPQKEENQAKNQMNRKQSLSTTESSGSDSHDHSEEDAHINIDPLININTSDDKDLNFVNAPTPLAAKPDQPLQSVNNPHQVLMPAIIEAARKSDLEKIAQLIESKANIDEADYRGYTALNYAIFLQNQQMKDFLKKNSADEEHLDNNKIPVHFHERMIELRGDLSDYDADFNPKVANESDLELSTACVIGLTWYDKHHDNHE